MKSFVVVVFLYCVTINVHLNIKVNETKMIYFNLINIQSFKQSIIVFFMVHRVRNYKHKKFVSFCNEHSLALNLFVY